MIFSLILLFIFIVFVLLMYFKKIPALLALPLMAIVFAIVAGVPIPEILTKVIADGSIRLHLAIVTALFGGMMAQFVKNSGIADTLIRKVAELAGENPFSVALGLTIVVAILFTVLGGLGAVSMVAIIVIPIFLSLGIPNIVAASLFLIGISLGGVLNLTNWQLYIDTLGLSQTAILGFALPFFGIFLLMLLVFLFVEVKRKGTNFLLAIEENVPFKEVPLLALLTPIIPVVLVFGFAIYNLLAKPTNPFEFPIITAFIIGLVYGMACIAPQHKDPMNLLTKSIFEGVNMVTPAVVLMIGIGMILNAVTHPMVSSMLMPFFSIILPSGPITYVLFFAILAPLSLYRGPLNIWGLGSGMLGIMLAVRVLPPAAIMAALMSVGQIQGVGDPTNTFNVWIASFLNISVQDILKKTIVYMWILAIIGLILASVLFFSRPASAATTMEGISDAIQAENHPVFIEIYRIKIVNEARQPISVSTDQGGTWNEIGKVLNPANRVNDQGYTASLWVRTGEVAATSVNAIHLKSGNNVKDDKGIIFSILPKEFTRSTGSNYNSYLDLGSSIVTDIPAGQTLFGGGYSPFVGNKFYINDVLCSGECSPRVGDVITIVVERPKKYPSEIDFENRFGGEITMKFPDGEEKLIGEVLRPVMGVGRFTGTQFTETGRIRANHAGVIDVSTSPIGLIGGFQIIPALHGMSPEMVNARIKTQWMVVGPPKVSDPSIEGQAPLFKYFIMPEYNSTDFDSDQWQTKLLQRFLVQVKYKNSSHWESMPIIYLDPDLNKPLPTAADRALENVANIRILFPVD